MEYLLTGCQTRRLLFRPVSRDDFADWLLFFQHPDTSLHWQYERETPEIECHNWYTKQAERYKSGLGGMNALIEKTTGRLAGHCGLLKQVVDGLEELEIAYSLLPAFWNKGYATEAATACRDHAFENRLAPSLISIISLTNKASERVALKVGMLPGKATTYRNNAVQVFRVWQPGMAGTVPVQREPIAAVHP